MIPMILNIRNFSVSLLISITFHVVLVVLFSYSVVVNGFFPLFIVIDILLICMALLPLVAVARHELDWYDPICIFGFIFLLMTGTFFPAYMLEPGYVQYYSSFGYSSIRYLDSNRYLFIIIIAEFILILFYSIVVFVNRYRMNMRPISIKKHESWAVFSTFLILFIVIGIPAAYLLFSSLPVSFLESITVDIGSPLVKSYEPGTARFAILVEIGLISLSLGVSCYMGISSKKSRLNDWLLLLAIFLTILFQLTSGSRITIVYLIVQYILIAKWFADRINKRMLLLLGVAGVMVVGAITLIRENPYISNDPIQVIDQLITGEAMRAYQYSSSSTAEPILNPNRVSAVALIYDYLNTSETFLHGETMIAGAQNLLADFSGRLNLINYETYVPLRLANEVILIWSFGATFRGGTLPPSIPGEFYMQLGWFSLITLSLLFAYLLRWLRTRLYNSRSLISRWIFLIITSRIIFAVPTEVSILANVLLYFLVVIGVYGFFEILYRLSFSRYSKAFQNTSI